MKTSAFMELTLKRRRQQIRKIKCILEKKVYEIVISTLKKNKAMKGCRKCWRV